MVQQVEVNDRRARYVVTAEAGQSSFVIDFPLDNVAYIRVYIDGVLQGGGYSVDLEALLATLDTPAAQGAVVTLEGVRLIERINGYPLRGEISSRLLNQDFNAVIEMVQEIRRDVNRAIILNKSEPDATSNVMPQFIEGRAIVCGPNGIALSSANFVELNENVLAVQQTLAAVLAAKDEVDTARDEALDAQAAAELAAENAGAVEGFDGSASTVSVDDTGLTYVSGANAQTALESVDAQIIAARVYTDAAIAATPTTGCIIDIQEFTSAGSWSKPEEFSYAIIEMWTPSGGGCAATTNNGTASSTASFGAHITTTAAGGGATGQSSAYLNRRAADAVATGADQSYPAVPGGPGGIHYEGNGNNKVGQDGGHGLYARKKVLFAALGSTEAVTPGTKGTGGAAGGVAGGDGRDGYVRVTCYS